jgi:hypothetical protein
MLEKFDLPKPLLRLLLREIRLGQVLPFLRFHLITAAGFFDHGRLSPAVIVAIGWPIPAR